MKRYIYWLLALGAAASGVLLSCKSGSHSEYIAGKPATGDWCIMRLVSEPDGLNPLTSTSADAQEIDGMVLFESLTSIDNSTLLDIPILADSLPEISPDHLQYTFHIRKNITFSDGAPATGNDFICYLKTVKNALIINAAPQRGYFENIQKAELVNGDPYTIRFTLNEPYFLANEICGGVLAVPKHIWDPKNLTDKIPWDELDNPLKIAKDPAAKEYANWFSDPAKSRDPKFLIGTGKYILESWETGQRITFRRNPNYWNAKGKNGQAWFDKIIYKVILDDNAAVTAIKGGEIDFIPNVPKILYVHSFDSTKDRDVASKVYDYPTMSYISWNLHNPLFQDQRVRMALAKLMNTEEIIKTMLMGMGRQITGTTYYHRPEYDTAIKPIAYDPDGAKQLLAEAGWKDTDGDGILDKNGQKFEFSILTIGGSAIGDKIMLIPIEAMRKVGIVADLERVDFSIYLQNARDHKFDAVFGGWSTSATEGDEYQIWHSSQTVGGSNAGFYNNPQVDSLIMLDRSTFDFNKRIEIHKQIQRIIFNDQPYAFLYAVKLAGAWNNRFHNVNFYPPRPCYDLTEWYAPVGAQKYSNAAATK